MKISNASISAVSCWLFLSQSLLANPFGGTVVNGSASINGTGNLLTVSQTSATAIINWNSFSIAQGQSTIFQFNGRAGSHSAVLNEVNTGNPSIISGLLESTVGVGGPIGGTVLVLNPSGILFSSTAQINVGNLTASTLGLADNNQFLNHRPLQLTGASTAGIQNQGSLNATGNIYLIANTVQNSGNITAGNQVGLAAGTQVTLMQTGSERMTVTAGSGAGAPVGVDNTATGQINATVAQLAAAGGNIYALAINNAGLVRATTVTHEGGAIYLRGNGGAVANSGTLDASGAGSGTQGGLVQVTGGNVTLSSGSSINVSGDAGGGSALIGGGSHGSDPSVPDAQTTTVQQGATINADATTSGNGGKVVVWSDGATTFSGQISARGGADAGNGGSAEVSGAQNLDISGHADLTAAHGATGDLLLDPGSVDIVSGANTGSEYANGTTGDITDGWVNNQLTTSSLSISTSDAGANGAAAPTLTVDTGAAISWNTSSSLSLTGANSVTVNGTISGTGTGGLTLSSPNGNIAVNNTISVGGGATLTALSGINIASSLTTGGLTTLNADSGNTGTGGLILGAAVVTGNNALTVSAGNMTFAAGGSLDSGTALTTINATGGVSIGLGATPITGGLNISDPNLGTITSGGLTLNTTGAGTVTVDGISSANSANVGTVSINSSSVDFASDPSTFSSGLNVAATAGIDIADSLTVGGPLVLNADSGNTGTGGLTLGAAVVTGNNPLTISAGNMTFSAGGSLDSGTALTTINATGGVSIGLGGTPAAGGLNISDTDLGTITSGGLTLNTTGAGTVTVDGITSANSANVGTVSINSSSVDFANNASTFAALDVASSGAAGTILGAGVTTTGSQTYGGAGPISGSGLITASELLLDGSGQVGSLGSPLQTAVGDIVLNKSAGDTFIAQPGSLLVDLSGTTGGALNLDAASGIDVNAALTLTGSAGLTLNADSANAGTGDLTVGAPISTSAGNAPVNITAADIDLTGGSVNSGSGLVSVTASDAGTIGLGSDTGDLTLTSAELGNITTSGGLTLNTTGGANVSIGGATAPNVTGPLTINAPAGNVTFDTAASSFNSLSVASAGGVTLDQNVTTTGDQSYAPLVTLGASVILTSSSVELSGGVNGAANSLTLDNSGLATLGGALTGVQTFSVSGASQLDGGTLTTTAGQSYGGQMTLGADTILSGTTLTLSGVTGAGHSLTLDNTGLATLNGAVSGVNLLSADGAGGTLLTKSTIAADNLMDTEGTTLNGGSVTTTGGDQDYTGTVTLGANTTLASGTVELETVNGGGNSLTLNNTGLATLDGAVTGVQALSVSGASQLNDGTVTTTAGQSYGGAMTLGADTTLSGTTLTLSGVTGAGHSLTLDNTGLATLNGAVSGVNLLTADGAGGTLLAKSTIAAANLTDTEGTTLNGGSVTTTGGDQDYTGTVTLGAATTLASGTVELQTVNGGGNSLTLNNTGLATLDGAVTGVQTFSVSGSSQLNDGTVTTTAGQGYGGQMTLGAATTLSGTTLTLSGVTGGGNNLTLDNTGLATLNGAISGVNLLTANGTGGTLLTKSTIAADNLMDTEGTTLSGGSVTTTGGDQDYTGTVTLGANTTLASGTIELPGVTGGGNSLTLDNSGLATINGAVSGVNLLTADGAGGTLLAKSTIAANNLMDTEGTTLNGGSVTTTGGDQDYTGTLTLGADTTLASGTVELSTVNGGGNTLTLNNTGLATLDGAFTGLQALSVSGASLLNDGAVTTAGGQSYAGQMTLGADTTLSGTTLTLSGVTGGGHSLTLDNTGLATLNGAVSGVNLLTADGAGGTLQTKGTIAANNLTDSEGTTLSGGSVTTTGGDQDYTGTVTLGANTTLASGTIELPGVTGAGNSLTLDNTGLATINGAVSGVNLLTADGVGGTLLAKGTIAADNLTDTEGTTLNGGSVTTTGGDQDYTGTLTLGADTTLASGTVELSTVNGGGNSLTLNNTGLATLGGAVTGLQALSVSGASLLNDGTVTTAAGQSYGGAMTLGADTILSGTTLTLSGVTGGGHSLTLDNTGLATINGAVSGVNLLTADGAGGTLLANGTIAAANLADTEGTTLSGGSVTTTGGDEDYTGTVTLGANTTLASGTIELPGVTGGGNSLTLDNTGLATISGPLSGINLLTADGAGGTLLAKSTIAANNLTDSEGTTLNGGSVTTTGGDQDYSGTVTLGADTTLASGTIELAGVTGAGNSLTLDNTGLATINGAVSGVNLLTADGAGGTLLANSTIAANNLTDSEGTTLSGGSVTTTGGDQDYTGTVALGANTTLASGTIELPGVTGGGNSLTLDNTGLATINGAVSGVNLLTADGAGGTLLASSTIAAANLTDIEGTTLNGGSVTTTGGDQNYTGSLTLGADTTLTSGTIELAGVTGAGHSLTLNNTGLATLNGAVSGVNLLTADGAGGTLLAKGTIAAANLTDAEGTTLSGGSVTTIGGDQDYSGTVTLGADTTLASETVELQTVNGGGNSLTLNNSGLATLNGTVSGVNLLTADGAGGTLLANSTIAANNLTDSEGTTLNGGSVTTTGGDQDYSGTVTLGADTTLASGTLELSTVNGAGFNLTLNNTGLATLNGGLNGVNLLTADGTTGTLLAEGVIVANNLVDSEGTTLNGASLTTAGGDQDYTGTVTLGAASTLTSGTIELAGVTGAGNNLTLNNTGLATLNGAENGLGTLTASGTGSLTVDNNISAGSVNDSEGVTTLNGVGGTETITTTGNQTYSGATVNLGANTTLQGATVSLPAVNLGSENLTLANSRSAFLNGAVTGTGGLTADGSGDLTINNLVTIGSVNVSEGYTYMNGIDGAETIKTTGGQTYVEISLGATTHLLGNPVKFSSVTYNNHLLTLGPNGFAPEGIPNETGSIFGALQRRERHPKTSNPQLNPAPSLPFATLVPVASSYPTRLLDVQL